MIRTIATVCVSVCLSVLLMSLFQKAPAPIVTVNLTKILNAQRMLAVRGATSNEQGWIAQAKDAGRHLKTTIARIANGRVVVISQALITGAADITPQVLAALGLPQNVPDITPSKNAVLGAGSLIGDESGAKPKHQESQSLQASLFDHMLSS